MIVVKKYVEYVSESVQNQDKQLLKACEHGDIDTVRDLLDGGADINYENNTLTPLSTATWNGHTEIVKLLLDRGADMYHANKSINPLILSCIKGYVDIASMLIEKGADMELSDHNVGWTPMICACNQNKKDIVILLLNKGAKIESRDELESSPLMHASEQGHIDIVKLLLENSANINAHDIFGKYCLDFNEEIWQDGYVQELIISLQPQNIQFFDKEIGILPSLNNKYKEVIEMSEMGIFG